MTKPPRENDGFPARLRRIRLQQGLTVKAAAKIAGISETSYWCWESGRVTPKLWRAGAIARALGVPVAALFTDELVVAEVVVSAETVAAIRRDGRIASEAAARRIADQLEPLLWASATAPPVDVSPGRRPKPRRTRPEVLAGVKQANEARARRDAKADQTPIQ